MLFVVIATSNLPVAKHWNETLHCYAIRGTSKIYAQYVDNTLYIVDKFNREINQNSLCWKFGEFCAAEHFNFYKKRYKCQSEQVINLYLQPYRTELALLLRWLWAVLSLKTKKFALCLRIFFLFASVLFTNMIEKDLVINKSSSLHFKAQLDFSGLDRKYPKNSHITNFFYTQQSSNKHVRTNFHHEEKFHKNGPRNFGQFFNIEILNQFLSDWVRTFFLVKLRLFLGPFKFGLQKKNKINMG